MKIKMLNKKAQEDVEVESEEEFKFVHLVLWAILLVVVLLIISYFTSAFINENLDVRDSEARIIAQRLLYSTTGISYIDKETERVYPNYVDINKLNSENLFSALEMEDNQMMALRVVVSSKSINKSWEAIYNDLWYERWLPLAGEKGSGASTFITEERAASIFQGNKYLGLGKVQVNVLMPNG